MPRVYISFRRSDAADMAHRIYEWLTARMEPNAVFMDLETAQDGDDGLRARADSVSAADVVLVMIGMRWLAGSSDQDQPPLDDPSDVVRLEIEQALQLHKPIIPLLVHNALMPDRVALPSTMAALIDKRAISIRSGRMFNADMTSLAHTILVLAPNVWIDTQSELPPDAARKDCPVCMKSDRVQKLSDRELFAPRPPMPEWALLPMNEAKIPVKSDVQIIAGALGSSLALAIVRSLLVLVIVLLANVVVLQLSGQTHSLRGLAAVISVVAGGLILVSTVVEVVLRVRSKAMQRKDDRVVNQRNQEIDAKNQQVNQENQQIEERNRSVDQQNREIEARRYALWDQMYLCSRDDITFILGSQTHGKTTEELYQQQRLRYLAFTPFC